MKHFFLFIITGSLLFLTIAASVKAATKEAESIRYLRQQGFLSTEEEFPATEHTTRLRALALIMHVVEGEVTPDPSSYTKKPKQILKDIPVGHPSFSLVKKALQRGIITVAADRRLHPDESVTFFEALNMILRAPVTSVEVQTPDRFHPIPPELVDLPGISNALTNGLVLQKSSGNLAMPLDKIVTHEELADMLYRYVLGQQKGVAEFGFASWYADGAAKTKLTKGKEYRDLMLTAAHRTLPFGTILRVTNLHNGKQIHLVVNDRGPFVPGRIIDLSKTAFSYLASPGAGVAAVKVEIAE